MTLTKADIIQDVSNQEYSKKKSAQLVESMLNILKTTLENGEDVLISGFGKFCVKEKGKRRGRNPASGQDLLLAERRVITFKCSSVLRNKIQG